MYKTTKNIINRGKGAGGSNTNKNGMSYEKITDLNDSFIVLKEEPYSKTIQFNENNKKFIRTRQSKFFKYTNEKGYLKNEIEKAHGCKNPDECYIDEINKNIFIIEKKFQQGSGSVCEKIQTPDFKRWQYERSFPSFKIIYIYCLSHWFKDNCKAELEYLKYININVFWGNDSKYKKNIINFINSSFCYYISAFEMFKNICY